MYLHDQLLPETVMLSLTVMMQVAVKIPPIVGQLLAVKQSLAVK